jgi:serine/threonine protein kinase
MPRTSSPSMPPLSAGATLGDVFAIVGLLGEGGAGTVYEATRTLTGERVAVKVLHSHLLGDRQIRGRFEREAKILARLHGPHVAPVLDFGELADPRDETRTLLYMALPRIDGPSLDAVMTREGPLPMHRVTDLMLQICDALKMAHAQGVVHRDLKPANVLLRGGTHVVVVDFGLAKILTGDVAATVLTAHNMVCGTPEYMAPEQARGEEIDERCDVYAAGVILYQLLTQTLPFTGATPLAVLTAHLTTPPTPARERAPNRAISPALDAIVMHALAKDPNARYSTATALAAAILHARVAPDDDDAVRPEAAHAATVPSFPGSPTQLSPSRPPPASKPAAPPPRSFALSQRVWTMIWIGAAVASISVGIWLSLNAP